MARTTATNFTGALQFPYATAAADLFKKEDVQTLALAVDQHDHTTGKGLIGHDHLGHDCRRHDCRGGHCDASATPSSVQMSRGKSAD